MSDSLEQEQRLDELFEEEQVTEQGTGQVNFLDGLYSYLEEEEAKDLNINIENEDFSIKSAEQANFFVKRLEEIRGKAAEVNRIADSEIKKHNDRVSIYREKELKSLEYGEAYCVGMLQAYAEKQLAENPKQKSVKLPHGTLSFRKQPDKFEYDEETLLTFLEENPAMKDAYVQYKASAKKAALKKDGIVTDGTLRVNGVEIPGVTVIPQGTKFEIK